MRSESRKRRLSQGSVLPAQLCGALHPTVHAPVAPRQQHRGDRATDPPTPQPQQVPCGRGYSEEASPPGLGWVLIHRLLSTQAHTHQQPVM